MLLAQRYRDCRVTVNVEPVANRMLTNKLRYEKIHADLPWWVVAIIHNLECSLDFTKHIHNGDPLTRKTVNVPAGRPEDGTPPFTWEESAEDALVILKRLHTVNWDVLETTLDTLERYNGLGYRRKGVVSPYLFSGTTAYTKGKYTSDGKYNPNAVSKQIGVVPFLKHFDIF